MCFWGYEDVYYRLYIQYGGDFLQENLRTSKNKEDQVALGMGKLNRIPTLQLSVLKSKGMHQSRKRLCIPMETNYNRIFHYRPSILGYLQVRKPPNHFRPVFWASNSYPSGASANVPGLPWAQRIACGRRNATRCGRRERESFNGCVWR